MGGYEELGDPGAVNRVEIIDRPTDAEWFERGGAYVKVWSDDSAFIGVAHALSSDGPYTFDQFQRELLDSTTLSEDPEELDPDAAREFLHKLVTNQTIGFSAEDAPPFDYMMGVRADVDPATLAKLQELAARHIFELADVVGIEPSQGDA